MKIIHIFAVLSLTLAVAACATNIKAKDETIVAPTAKFGSYQSYTLNPLTVEKSGGDSSDIAATKRIETELAACMAQSLPNQGGNKKLLITPTITDLKKVNTSERIFLGAMAGSSAVLLNVKYTDAQTNEVIANPTFYSKASAMGGAWTFGSTDNVMLSRVVTKACDYTKQYR